MARKKVVDDLLDTKPSKPTTKAVVKAAAPVLGDPYALVPATPQRSQGNLALYNRRKSSPIAVTTEPDKTWALVDNGRLELFATRKAGVKAYKTILRGGAAPAPRGRKKTAEVDLLDTSGPTADPDLFSQSERGEGVPQVPSVWCSEGGSMGLLVYYGRSLAKLVTLLSGEYGITKAHTDKLFPSKQASDADYRHRAAEYAKTNPSKDLPYEPGDAWWPAETRYTPRHFASIVNKSTIGRSRAAAAFIAKITSDTGAAVDDLLGDDLLSTTEEDLLS